MIWKYFFLNISKSFKRNCRPGERHNTQRENLCLCGSHTMQCINIVRQFSRKYSYFQNELWHPAIFEYINHNKNVYLNTICIHYFHSNGFSQIAWRANVSFSFSLMRADGTYIYLLWEEAKREKDKRKKLCLWICVCVHGCVFLYLFRNAQ